MADSFEKSRIFIKIILLSQFPKFEHNDLILLRKMVRIILMSSRYKKDFYFYKAKRERYLARSIYKLKEMDEKYKLIKRNDTILDLGCYPGSWLQYCSKVVGSKGIVLGVDQKEPDHELGGNVKFLKADVFDLEIGAIEAISPDFEVLLSDMAPFTTGFKSVDHHRIMALARRSLKLADDLLKKGGNFVCKIFEGKDAQVLLKEVKGRFKVTKIYKPRSSKKESREIYLVGLGKI